MARLGGQRGTRSNRLLVIEEHVDNVSLTGPCLFCYRRLLHLPYAPRDPCPNLAYHPINRHSHSRDEIAH